MGKKYDFAGAKFSVKDEAGNERGIITIGEDNQGSLGGLPVGNYTITETAAPANGAYQMNGDTFTGKYHVYFKLDGDLVYAIDQKIMSGVAEGGRIHLTDDVSLNYLDAYAYETPQYVSVSDLSLDSN